MQEWRFKVKRNSGQITCTVVLAKHFDFPRRVPKSDCRQKLAEEVRRYPTGRQRPWGIPFQMARGPGARVIAVSKSTPAVTIHISSKAAFLCILHEWKQVPEDVHKENPREGTVVAEYGLAYVDGTRHVQPVRGRFEVAMAESPGPPWLARYFKMWASVDPVELPSAMEWGRAQTGLQNSTGFPLVYAMPNPHPEKKIQSFSIRGLKESPLLVAGLTLYTGSSHPLAHLPRRSYLVRAAGKPVEVKEARVDLGGVARIARTYGPRGKPWLKSPYLGTAVGTEPVRRSEDIIQAFGAEDATLSVTLKGRKNVPKFHLGEAFHKGRSCSGSARLEVLDKRRQWMLVKVIDASTDKPTPSRIHFSGARGEYIAPYGHHEQVNPHWFEDYGADLQLMGRNYAYVPGEFTTDMPVGDIFVEICKGFEYEPVRKKVTVRPGQRVLELRIRRWKDLRSRNWVTADTHVHFISPHTAWLEAQAEGINVVNLLASQWGRLFTNVGDYTGRVGIVEDDTIVYVGTENRNHMLGHMSMLGTRGLPVFPMCCGGPGESWVGDPDLLTLAEWALKNKRRGGIVIRPHYPYCGHTEDPVPIIKGLVDALEIRDLRGEDFPTQEWYRYLNCGYRVAVAGGTDKMSAQTALGWLRTYACMDRNRPFTYDNWARAVRAGRTVATNGPIMEMHVEGKNIGDTVQITPSGATLEVHASAGCFLPLEKLEIVHNGKAVASRNAPRGAKALSIRQRVRVTGSGWIAARCAGYSGHPGSYVAAHTSPVYIKSGQTRLFDGPAAHHMLSLVRGGVEYLRTIATVFDEPSRKRMVKVYDEVRMELESRLRLGR